MVMLGGLALYEVALAAGGGDSGHGGAVLNVLLELIVILLAAKLGGDLFERVSQPAVLGELIIGMLIGNAHLIGIDLFQGFGSNLTLEILAELGVIILLFEVGLESTVREMRQVGLTSLLVAVLGVIAPFFLGWGVSIIFLPEESELVHAFIGATLCATSVGITARVLKDIGKTSSRESKIILGAAVIDDVLGLVILAIVSGIITAASTGQDGISAGQVSWIIGKALIFIFGAIVVGQWLLPKYFKLAIRIRGKGVFLSFALLICFGLAYVAGKIGLAPIVGAFAAGLIYDRIEYQEFEEREKHTMEELISPIAIFLVPIFFVRLGMLVDLTDGTPCAMGHLKNPMVRASLTGPGKVRFRDELGVSSGEDAVFFFDLHDLDVTHVFASGAVVREQVPVERSTLRYQLRRAFWYGNTQAVTTQYAGTSTWPRLMAGGAKRVLQSLRWFVPSGGRWRWRYGVAELLGGVGRSLGALGVRIDHP